jgi:Domain of unknown function (DUF4394)
MKNRPLALALAAAFTVVLSAPAAAPAAEALYGATSTNQLITFHSDSPGHVRSAVPISGLQPNEIILALDVRPATGQLYGLGSLNHVYVISPLSGATMAVGSGTFSPPLAGTSFGFDFNPAVDRIRVTSDGRQNLRINPEDGAVAAQDDPLAYAEGDAGAGINPAVGSAAYTAEAQPRLLDIDSTRDVLVQQNPPNDGKLNTIGPLGVDIQEPVGFDIAADGRGYVAAKRAGGAAPELFVVDLATGTLGAASLVSTLATAHGTVHAIASTGAVPDDTVRPTVLVDLDRRQSKKRLRSRLIVPVSCSETCDITVALLSGREIAASGEASLGGAGATRVRVFPNARGKRLGKKTPKGKKKVTRTLTLRVTAVDAAGNGRRVSKTIRFSG